MYYEDDGDKFGSRSIIYRERREKHYYDDDDRNDRNNFDYGENDVNDFGKSTTSYDDDDDNDENTFGKSMAYGKEMYYDESDKDDGNNFGKRTTYRKGKETYYNEDEDDEPSFGEGKEAYYDDDDDFGKSTTYRKEKMYYDYDEDNEDNFFYDYVNKEEMYCDYDEDNGNKFGKRIPYRKGKAIQIAKYENGKIILIKESLEIIQNIEEPVAIISVVGSYRRGKSYFSNVLHGRHDGFELGSKVDGCTKGIFMWDTPFLHNGCKVIILDCEGIDDPKQDEVWAMKLFILCLAISSTFIYNINGVVGRDDIGKLYTMTDLSKFLLNSEDDEKDYLPRLVVLLRDFGLEDPDDFRDYFLERLAQVDSDAAAGITNHFKDFNVYALPHPGCKKKVLHELEKIKTSQLDDDFISKMSHAVSEVYDNLSPKMINSKSMTGISFSKFLQDCIQHMNATTNALNTLSLPNQYTSLIKFMSGLAIDVGFTYYSVTMTIKSIDYFPLNWEAFENEHVTTLSKADFLFSEKLIESHSQTLDARAEFETRIDNEKQVFSEKNSEAIKNYNLNLANSLWQVHVKPGLTFDYLFENHEKFDNALEVFMEEFTNESINSPEAKEIYEKFKNQETESALKTLNKMFESRDAIKSVEEARQEIINQVNQLQERLTILLEENIEEEQEYEKQIDELVKTIDNLQLKLDNK